MRAARLAPLAFLTACTGPQSMLEPGGPGAASIATMWWVLLWIMTAVFVIVLGALGWALFRRRGTDEADDVRAERRRVGVVVLAGAAVPAVILAGILVYTLTVLDSVGPSAGEADGLTVTVIGKQFWWDIRYPRPGGDTIVTANELHIPVGRTVTLRLESDNVIHSVWIPRLHGKTDMIPGRTNRMWLRADEPGVYHGQCAEYCGEQHAWMKMLVVAQPEPEFEAWLAGQAQPAELRAEGAAEPAAEPAAPVERGERPVQVVPDTLRSAEQVREARIRRGLEVFLDPEHRCTACHTIRGVSERGRSSPGEVPNDGPDLTHVASRRTLASGMLRTTRGNMGGWLANPQVIKPGNRMPRIPLEPEELNALLEYLMSLR